MMTHGGDPLMWASTRQPFVTQSTAVAELLAYNEAYHCGESAGALLEVLGYVGVKKHMKGDSKSGISQLTADTGAWRTRHLRLRSAKLGGDTRSCLAMDGVALLQFGAGG